MATHWPSRMQLPIATDDRDASGFASPPPEPPATTTTNEPAAAHRTPQGESEEEDDVLRRVLRRDDDRPARELPDRDDDAEEPDLERVRSVELD